jgi:hypothetical protein
MGCVSNVTARTAIEVDTETATSDYLNPAVPPIGLLFTHHGNVNGLNHC